MRPALLPAAPERNGDNAMAFQSVPQAAEAVIAYQMNGENVFNVIAATRFQAYDLADLTVLAEAVDASVAADWLPVQSQDVNYLNTTVRGLEFENDQEVVVDTGAGAGLAASKTLPGNVTFCVKKTSSFTGRSARGRLYWIGMTPGQLQSNENLLNVVDADAIEAAIDAMRAAISATVWTAAIVSRFKDNVKRTVGIVNVWVDSSFVDLKVDSMRPRLTR